MKQAFVDYQDGSEVLEGYLVSHEDGKARPTVLISHAWGGLGDFEKEKANALANLGYNAFAIDMYGKGKRGGSLEENRVLMAPFVENRGLLRQRIVAAFRAAQSFDVVDAEKIAAVGFCFGGMCVLDLARSGSPAKGVVSVHGLLKPPPESLPNELIKAKVLALHGYEDPMVPPEDMTALAAELTDAGVDWQVHAYGLTYHSFTNPKANNAGAGTVFNPTANRRAWQAIENFLAEIFE
ncbi:dienelactone hydrolase family protein [Proteobacteria bacterium 005FR1]|nr:dienelactone hydrolase family protein [Proteobacteria bacterium 005FR1]